MLGTPKNTINKLARNYSKEYEKESKSTDQLKIRISKELHQKFIENLGETSKSEWILNKIRKFVNEETNR